MFRPLQYLRGYVYPHNQPPGAAGLRQLRGSDAILGMTAVMLIIVGAAFVIEVTLF